MNFSKHDMVILVGSFMVIVFMTIVFPTIGLTDTEVEENEVPELNFSESTLELVGERPSFPRSPTSGELQFSFANDYENQQTIEENEDNDFQVLVETFCYEDNSSDCVAQLSIFEGSNSSIETYNITESDFNNSSTTTVEAQNDDGDEWVVKFEFIEAENWGSEDVSYVVGWELIQAPGSGGWIDNVPILGGIYSTGEELASILGWGITVFFWFCTWIVELALNAISMLLTGVFFGFDLINFMLTNYNSMLSEVSGIASLILLVPVILLSVELLKLGFIFIKLLPTT